MRVSSATLLLESPMEFCSGNLVVTATALKPRLGVRLADSVVGLRK